MKKENNSCVTSILGAKRPHKKRIRESQEALQNKARFISTCEKLRHGWRLAGYDGDPITELLVSGSMYLSFLE